MKISLLRWIVKKSARTIFAAIGNFTKVTRPRVITYHYFAESPKRSPFSISKQDFERQISFLSKSGRALSIDEMADKNYLKNLSGNRIVVTIDDGHKSIIQCAVPILRRYNVGAIFFVVPSWIGLEEFVTEQDIEDVHKCGFVVGSHSVSHPLLAPLTYSEQYEEVRQSKVLLERMTGSDVDTFAYPYGTRHAFNTSTRNALVSAGYDAAFTSQHGSISAASDPLALPRIKIESGDPFWVFRRACDGSLDRWRYVDQFLAFMQRPPRRPDQY